MTRIDMLDEAAACTTEEKASALVDRLVTEAVRDLPNQTPEGTRDIILSNIGYLTGYCDRETHDRILRLFHTEHPIFGLSNPTAEEAFKKGLEVGEQSRKKHEAAKAT